MHTRMIRRMISALLIAVLLAAGLVPSALATVSAKVNVSSARVYQYASTSARSIKVAKGLPVEIGAIANGWAWVSHKGNKAYIPLKWLAPTTKVPAYTKSSTALYAWNLKRMGTASAGMGVYALGTIGNYYLVMNPSNGALAYVPSGSLSQTKPSSGGSSGGFTSSTGSKATTTKPNVPTSGNAQIEAMLDFASSLVGTPYSSMSCSIFVYNCMRHVGKSAKDTAAKQFADNTYPAVPISDIQRGDLLFFDTSGDGNIDHAAIYLGNGWFVESSRTAGGVLYNYMTGYYQGCIRGARRIF